MNASPRPGTFAASISRATVESISLDAIVLPSRRRIGPAAKAVAANSRRANSRITSSYLLAGSKVHLLSCRIAARDPMRTRIMNIERKSESLNGFAHMDEFRLHQARYDSLQGPDLSPVQRVQSQHIDVETRDEYWISGPRKDGADRLYKSNLPVEIDDDVREEYWTSIRKRPDLAARKRT